MIFIFGQYDSNKQIIIYAESYLEAKEALFEFNPYADKIYNILEYKMYNVDFEKYCKFLNIDYDDGCYPRIISQYEFDKLCDAPDHIILDKQFKDINHLRVIQKKDIQDGTSQSSLAVSTSEFVDMLKQNAEIKTQIKNEMSKMLNIVGDIWYIKFRPIGGLTLVCDKDLNSCDYYIYGKSRLQCVNLFNKLSNKHKIKWCPKPELLINYNRTSKDMENYTNDEVNAYKRMTNYMKEKNIKRFPFTTFNV